MTKKIPKSSFIIDSLIKRLEDEEVYHETNDSPLDINSRNWGTQQGILISVNEAINLIKVLKNPDTISPTNIKIRVNSQIDRDNIVIGLANAGLKVWVEEEISLTVKTYYVIFEYK